MSISRSSEHPGLQIAMTNPVKLVANPVMLFTLLLGGTVDYIELPYISRYSHSRTCVNGVPSMPRILPWSF